jgi:hypothetical protein
MADRIASDNDSVSSRRLTLETAGRTSRPRLELPADLAVDDGDVVRLTLDDGEYHARVERGLDGALELRGAFDNPRLAKSGDGEDRLAEWVADSGVEPGRSVLLDVLTEGYHFGLREPGARVVYTVRDPPQDSLSSIAESLEE